MFPALKDILSAAYPIKVWPAQGWEKLDRSQDEGGEDAPEDHTIVIQDEYNDEVVEDTADEEEDDADFDASGSVKKIVGTSPKWVSPLSLLILETV